MVPDGGTVLRSGCVPWSDWEQAGKSTAVLIIYIQYIYILMTSKKNLVAWRLVEQRFIEQNFASEIRRG